MELFTLERKFTIFADFNLCGPSINASNHCKAGYTTDSGIIKPHLQCFRAFSDHPKADINYLVKRNDVQVIGVSLAKDGTALKPGLEFDIRQKRIIGLTFKVDWNYVCDHPVIDPNSLRSRADLERILSNYNLSLDRTVPTLCKHLSQHLDQLEAKVTKCVLQTDVLLSKPAALCMVSDDILLCADDGHRAIYQIQLERDGVTIKGKARKLVRYPEGVYRLESMSL